jgi:hypothetical protein
MPREHVWGSGGIAPPILTSALDGGEWSASRPGRITPGIHWRRGWVGPKVDLSMPGIEPVPSIPLPVAIPTELSLGLYKDRSEIYLT